MALGLGKDGNGEKASEENGSGTSPTNSHELKNMGDKNYYDGFSPDAEAQNAGHRKMSRIGPPVTNSISGNLEGRRLSADAAAGDDVTVGQQMELEAGNAIQYRTCSWQKV